MITFKVMLTSVLKEFKIELNNKFYIKKLTFSTFGFLTYAARAQFNISHTFNISFVRNLI